MAEKGRKIGIKRVLEERARSMVYNPLSAVRQDINPLGMFVELSKISVLRAYMEDIGDDRVFRIRSLWYMIWLYSKDSALNVRPPEPLNDRKLKALGLAGFVADSDNRYEDRVLRDLVQLEDSDFVLCVLHFLRHQRSDLWNEIIVCEEQLFEALRLRLMPTNDLKEVDLKKKLRLESKELVADKEVLWEKFWADHDDLREDGDVMLYESLEDRARINTGDEA